MTKINTKQVYIMDNNVQGSSQGQLLLILGHLQGCLSVLNHIQLSYQ